MVSVVNNRNFAGNLTTLAAVTSAARVFFVGRVRDLAIVVSTKANTAIEFRATRR